MALGAEPAGCDALFLSSPPRVNKTIATTIATTARPAATIASCCRRFLAFAARASAAKRAALAAARRSLLVSTIRSLTVM